MSVSVNMFFLLMIFNIALAYSDSDGIRCEDSNTSYNSCGPFCVSTCQNPLISNNCIALCVPGCFCKQGFIRDEESNTCVRIQDCPEY
ncbi:hypothetical protein NQ314_005647 [Rhamnusium bicolor]|uniref:TIL domain-containing protein n=1 Tax=Rhamnusium bicolor TaxID=1586634 RepID=A0AAV8ZGA2_9CUCU|nr:hypothetical protein NQ314_005647 [Rhamnusium bicolor]